MATHEVCRIAPLSLTIGHIVLASIGSQTRVSGQLQVVAHDTAVYHGRPAIVSRLPQQTVPGGQWAANWHSMRVS